MLQFHQLAGLFWIKRVKYWSFVGFILYSVYSILHEEWWQGNRKSGRETSTESWVRRKSLRLLCALRYTLAITLKYQEN
jgi:hypothetical protein